MSTEETERLREQAAKARRLAASLGNADGEQLIAYAQDLERRAREIEAANTNDQK
jgi:hypothetical protein